MGDLTAFAKRVETRLANANREPHWNRDEAERYMTDVAARRRRYEDLTARLREVLIAPRLATLAGYFSNASPTSDEPFGHCSYWFGYCERFPATTKVSFVVEHDVRFEKVALCYETSMMPVFIKLHERDKLTLSLDDVRDDVVEAWVEERLLEFVDAYLQIDRGQTDFDDESTTDPVCGMRISRSSAAASDSYRGHPYFFCSHECQQRFAREPTAYVDVKAE